MAQCYKDAWSDYVTALSISKSAHRDWIFITASNEAQAVALRLQIDKRLEKEFFPSRTRNVVIPDINGKRIGSGCATLSIMRHIGKLVGISEITKQKILVCHSGGDSKRIPQYSIVDYAGSVNCHRRRAE